MARDVDREMARIESTESTVLRVWRWCRDHGPHVMQFLAAVSALIAGALDSPRTRWSAVAVSVLLTAVSIVVMVRSHDRTEVLRRGVEERQRIVEQQRDAVRWTLTRMGQRLLREVGLWDEFTRISIYGHASDRGGVLYLLGRASANPSIGRPGRPEYPDDTGYIGIIWRTNYFFKRWVNRASAVRSALDNGYDEAQVEALSMIALSVWGVRLEQEGEPRGILLVESERRASFDASELDSLKASSVFSDIRDLVIASEPVFEPLALQPSV